MSEHKALCCMVFEGYADWEPALAVAQARGRGNYEVRTVGFGPASVRSAGGFRIQPDLVIEQLRPETVRMLIVPGGDNWAGGDYPVSELESKLRELRAAHVPVAAICGATVACARAGLYADHQHTSNHPKWLATVAPNYAGAELYRDELCVRDRGLISAAGTASTEFAREILAELEIMTDAHRAIWFELFKTGRLPSNVDAEAFFKED